MHQTIIDIVKSLHKNDSKSSNKSKKRDLNSLFHTFRNSWNDIQKNWETFCNCQIKTLKVSIDIYLFFKRHEYKSLLAWQRKQLDNWTGLKKIIVEADKYSFYGDSDYYITLSVKLWISQ